MKALSIQQPWAFCITNGTKRVENRSWGTKHRGLLLIHAGQTRQDVAEEIHDDSPEMNVFDMQTSPRGAIVGICNLVDCLPIGEILPKIGVDFWNEQHVWAGGPYCWILRDPIAFATPIPLKGALALFEVPDYIEKITYVEEAIRDLCGGGCICGEAQTCERFACASCGSKDFACEMRRSLRLALTTDAPETYCYFCQQCWREERPDEI